jgi:hypothetical protein
VKPILGIVLLGCLTTAPAAEIHVRPTGPVRTLAAAQQEARKTGASVMVHAGTYYLAEPLVFTAADAGATYAAAPGERVVISGGLKLDLKWEPFKDGIMQARTPAGLAMDQLFVNGRRQLMARYPNYDPSVRPYGGYAADAFSKERAARWADPSGGYIHAMHVAHWGGYDYRITGKNTQGEVTYEGGWQNNRQMGMHPQFRYVENIFEELDAPGEWFHNARTGTLYYYPPTGVDLKTATVEVVQLRNLAEFNGAQKVTLRGFIFRHAARTFMDTREPLLRSDWTIYRGGALLFNNSEDCTVADCGLDQLGGNAIFVNNRNRRIRIAGCDIHDTGASAVAFVGDPQAVRNPLFEYNQRQDYTAIDKTPGPKTDNYPADCTVEDCLIRNVGVVEKQATGVEITMAQGITVRHCSIYDASRAGINIGDGCWGGNVIEFCDVFDTVLETGDHGSFNSWGRDRYWGLNGAPEAELPALALLDAVKPNLIRNSRWRCDHGWDVDLDDGSSNYEIYNNLFLHGGLKLREGFHRRVWNNIAVNSSLHAHVWYANGGDIVTNNIWMTAYPSPILMPPGKCGKEIDRNFFMTESDQTKYAGRGWDINSLSGDPLFVDPAKGDYRVGDGSPALKLGFQNFPMDQFGVESPRLKALARTPVLPALATTMSAAPPRLTGIWLGAAVQELQGEEYSSFGVSRESGGVHLAKVPAGSLAAKAGFRDNDLIQGVNGKSVRGIRELLAAVNAAAGKPLTVSLVRGQKMETVPVANYIWYSLAPAQPGAQPKVALTFSAQPQPANGPASELGDGKLTAGYGPVFANQVTDGRYKADLGRPGDIREIRVWSYRQEPSRVAQRFVLFGSNAAQDPGWNTGDAERFTPIASVDTTAEPSAEWQTTTLHGTGGVTLGRWRWLVWAVQPPNGFENTSYQEIEVMPASAGP